MCTNDGAQPTIETCDTLTAEMNNKYPDYTGPISTSGTVTVTFPTPGKTRFAFDLQGLQANCVNCGIHIHAGTTCAVAGEVGGHYFKDTDNWTTDGGAVYNSDAAGAASGSFEVSSGFDTYPENVGHAVVIHDKDNNRVSCTILAAAAECNPDLYPDVNNCCEKNFGSVEYCVIEDVCYVPYPDATGYPTKYPTPYPTKVGHSSLNLMNWNSFVAAL